MEMITEAERQLLEQTADMYNDYCALPEEHPMEHGEFVTALHTLQNIIMSRSARRELNRLYQPNMPE